MECIFCKIARKEIGKLVYKDELFVAFHDQNPKAKIHILIIPRKHIESLDGLNEADVS